MDTMVYFSFLSTFYRILPLPHIIAVPTHPFVRLALITYLNPGVQPISSLLSSALTSLHMFEPSEDIVLALLIISHLPVSQYWTVIDPYGAGARAHQMATALGLPDSARWLKLLRHEIEQEWNKKLLNRAILVGFSTLDLSYVHLLTMNTSSGMRCSIECHGTFHKSRNHSSTWLKKVQDTDLHLSIYELVPFFSSHPRNRSFPLCTTFEFPSNVPYHS